MLETTQPRELPSQLLGLSKFVVERAAMSSAMTTERAVEIVKQCAEMRARWGKYAFPPYTQAELMDALVVLHRDGRFDAPSDADITKLRRQLAACQNREKARGGQAEPDAL